MGHSHRQHHKKANSTLGFLRRNIRFINPPNTRIRNSRVGSILHHRHKQIRASATPCRKIHYGGLQDQRPGMRYVHDKRGEATNTSGEAPIHRAVLLLQSLRGWYQLLPVSSYKRGRNIRAKSYTDFDTTNIVDRSVCLNTRGFIVPASRTEQYRNPFFIRTTIDWNQLSESIVNCDTIKALKSALESRD